METSNNIIEIDDVQAECNMKKILPSIILIDDVQAECNINHKYPDDDDIEAALLLIDSGCLVNPIIVRRIGVTCTYKLLPHIRDYEYTIVLRAHEIDPEFKSINAFIADTQEEEDNLIAQAEFFK